MTNKKDKEEDNFLEYKPIIKHNNWKKKNGNVFLIFYHDKRIDKFLAYFFKKSKVRDIRLDDLSSKVWLCMNGKNTVKDINIMLCNETGDSFEEGCKRIILFLRYLVNKGWIEFQK